MSDLPFSCPAQFEPLCHCEAPGAGDAHWFVFRGSDLLVEMGPLERPSDDLRVRARPAWARLPLLQKNHNLWGNSALRTLYLGRLNRADCWAAELPEGASPPGEGLSWQNLRALFSVLDEAHFALAGRALQLVDWDRTHQFCGRCGARTEAKRDERTRVCPACKLSAYPRVAPAVMALVLTMPGTIAPSANRTAVELASKASAAMVPSLRKPPPRSTVCPALPPMRIALDVMPS